MEKETASDWEHKICKMDLNQLHIPENKVAFRVNGVMSGGSRRKLEEEPPGQRKRVSGASRMNTVTDGDTSKQVRKRFPLAS